MAKYKIPYTYFNSVEDAYNHDHYVGNYKKGILANCPDPEKCFPGYENPKKKDPNIHLKPSQNHAGG